MTDIANIPTNELLEDRQASIDDADLMRIALLLGITEYPSGKTQDRLDRNVKIIAVVEAELGRRGVDYEVEK